ncbi:MAG: PaaI family thioesterase [Longimicrobiales bacterium]
MAETGAVHFDARENGPPGVAHGGTLAGRMAQALGAPAEITLRRPAPLNTDLTLERRGDQIVLLQGNQVLANAVSAQLELEAPRPPSLAEAIAATQKYIGHVKHAFPTCWVCGTARSPGDGMRIFAGRVGARDVAADWRPHGSLADASGIVKPEFVWAALDCPGGWAALVDIEPKPVVLGRISARLERVVRADAPHIVTAWKIASEGRKHIVGSAIFDEQGELCAIARATWLEVEAKHWT